MVVALGVKRLFLINIKKGRGALKKSLKWFLINS